MTKIPLFKSHFSIGKSILKIDRIFEIAQEKGLEEVVLVEDSMGGFRSARKLSEKLGMPLRFGLRIETSCLGSEPSKVVFFAKNSIGVDSLRRIYTKANTKNNGVYEMEKEELGGIQVAIPFYDSFIHRNLQNFGVHELDLKGLDPIFFSEDNHHPFDYMISRAMEKQGVKTVKAQTILYEMRDDFPAFQFYKAVCNRKAGRRSPTFERPELNYFCSDNFCVENI